MAVILLFLFALALQTEAYNGVTLGGLLGSWDLDDVAATYPNHGSLYAEDMDGELPDIINNIMEYLPLQEDGNDGLYEDDDFGDQVLGLWDAIEMLHNELPEDHHRERRSVEPEENTFSENHGWHDLDQQINTFIDNSLSGLDPSKSGDIVPYGFFDDFLNKQKEQQVCAKVKPKVCELLKPMLPCLTMSDLLGLQQAMQEGPVAMVELMLTEDMFSHLTSQDHCLTPQQRDAFSKLLEHRDLVLQFAPCFNASLVPDLKAAMAEGMSGIVDLVLSEKMHALVAPCMGEQGSNMYAQLLQHKGMVMTMTPCLNMSMLPDLKAAMAKGLPGIINFTLSESTITMLSPCLKQSIRDLLLKMVPKKPMLIAASICFTRKVRKALMDAYQDGGMVAVMDVVLTQDMYDQLSPCLKNDTRDLYERLLANRDLVMEVAPCLNLTVLQAFKEQLNGGKLSALMALLTPQFYEMLSPCLSNCTRDVYRLALDARNKQAYAIKALDAIGKPPAGIKGGNVQWLGDMAECRAVHTSPPNTTGNPEAYYDFSGRYCTTKIVVHGKQESRVRWGMCIPDSCDATSIRAFESLVLTRVKKNVTIIEARCPAEIPFSHGDCIALAVCVILAILVVMGTLCDGITRYLARAPVEKTPATKPRAESHVHSIYDPNAVSPDMMNSDPDAILVQNDSVEMQRDTESRLQYIEERLRGNVQESPEWEDQYKRMRDGETGVPCRSFCSSMFGLFCDVIISFSCITNTERLMNCSTSGRASAIDGIRVLTSGWVVLGHTFVGIMVYMANSVEFLNALKTFWYQPVVNTALAADSMFVLSGFLVAYLTLSRMRKGRFFGINWVSFYLHRIWRFTPTYMALVMIWATLVTHLPQGPLATLIEENPRHSSCPKYWWTNALYINNFLPSNPSEACMGWSWYLADDMQFFILSPIFIIGLYKLWKVFVPMMTILIAAGVIGTGLVARYLERDWINPIGSMGQVFQGGSMDEAWGQLFVRPYHRAAPYLMGILAAFVLLRTRAKTTTPSQWWKKALYVLFWTLVLLMSAMCVYGMTGHYEFKGHFPVNMSSTYLAASRSVFAGCVALALVACNSGMGGPINTFLSWRIFKPFARLSFIVFLIHPMIMEVTYKSRRVPYYFTATDMAYVYIGHLVLSYLVAFVVHLAIEAPSAALERMIRRRWNERRVSDEQKNYCC